jgi:hypothetical protein
MMEEKGRDLTEIGKEKKVVYSGLPGHANQLNSSCETCKVAECVSPVSPIAIYITAISFQAQHRCDIELDGLGKRHSALELLIRF